MSLVIGVGQYTILDLNDAISGATPPLNPTEGTLWIDTTGGKNTLKQYNEVTTSWVVVNLDLADLDPTASTTLGEVKQSIADMSDDSVITDSEKIFVKEKLIAITGSLSFTTVLPTVSEMDTSVKGEVYGVRLEARNAGLSTSHSDYIAVSTKYGDLKTYLEGLSPSVWDATTANTNVTASIWNTWWKSYYDAVWKLRQTIVAQQKTNVDDAIALSKRLSTRGLAVKDGYSTFTTQTASQMYFHGYDASANPADVNPYLVVNGGNITILKGVLNPGQVFDRGYLLYNNINQCWYLVRIDPADNQWKRYNVGKTGHGQPFFFDDINDYIVGMLTEL